uniref:Globin family profile domain-containing protein n=1 Tax=Parascaris univalens TaxID=6257 RepID=A0A915AI51_PARUN
MGQAESASCPAELNLSERTSKKSIRVSGTPSVAVKSEELLTAYQRRLLEKSWRKSQKTGLENIGAHVFLKIYRREPSVASLFRIHDVPHEELKYNKKFQNHAMTFIRSIDFILENLNQFDDVANFCRQLGRRHARYISLGFRPEYWDIFAEALTECAIDWEGGLRCREALNGWRTLVSFIIEQMRVGFREAKREQQDRRAMLNNAIVSSAPTLAYTVVSIRVMPGEFSP